MSQANPEIINDSAGLAQICRQLADVESIGLDTEFLRERTFFPKLCLLQLSAAGQVWLVDTLRVGSLEPLMPALTAAHSRKLIHAARQDLEAQSLRIKADHHADIVGRPCNSQNGGLHFVALPVGWVRN